MVRGQVTLGLSFAAAYSSTCPCSAALARQLIQERFRQDFSAGKDLDFDAVVAWLGSEAGICATPHSQRSSAEVKLRLVPSFQSFPSADLSDWIEGALKTQLQATVDGASDVWGKRVSVREDNGGGLIVERRNNYHDIRQSTTS